MKVHETRRTDAFDVAAIGCEIQIRLENLALAIARFEPECCKHLLQFAADAAAVDRVAFACQLHRQCRAAHAALAREGGVRAAHHGCRIHAGVPVEPAVFIAHHRFGNFRRDCVERQPQAVLFVAGGSQAQECAVFGVDGGRVLGEIAERRFGEDADKYDGKRNGADRKKK